MLQRQLSRGTRSVLNLREHSAEILYSPRGRAVSNVVEDAAPSPRPIGREAQRLLAGAGLPNNELVTHIHRELRSMGVPPKEIPPFNKIAMSVWLDRTGRRVGTDKIMQAVGSVLKKYSRGTLTDWPLK